MKNILDGFVKSLEDRDVSELTVRGYLSDAIHFTRWFEQTNGEALTLERVTPTDIREYRQYLLTVERRKANTINRRLSALSMLMAWARKDGLIQMDPTENVKGIDSAMSAPKWLDKREQFALHRAIEKDLQVSKLRYPKRWLTRRRDASMTVFLLHTGLRLSELMALQLEDVKVFDRKGSVSVQNGKGKKQRVVPMNAEARKAIDEWLNVRPQKGNRLWVAVETDEESLSGRTVQRVLKRYAQEAGIEELTPHILRHTFAKNLVNNGVGLEKVAMLLGHSSLNTTRIYITPDERELEFSVEKLAGM